MWFVYIIECVDGTYYTGSTNDVQKRFKNHIEGNGAKYTKSHKPVKVIYQEELLSKSDALKREIELKKLSKNRKKELVGLGISVLR